MRQRYSDGEISVSTTIIPTTTRWTGYDCAYAYDQSGKRTTLVSGGPEAYTVAYDYDLNNCLTRETKTAGSSIARTDYRYDPNGNTLAVVPAMLSGAPATGVPSLSLDEGLGSATLMQYDGLNRLVRTETGDTLAEYTYRPDGLRHSKVVDGVTTTPVWFWSWRTEQFPTNTSVALG